MAYTALLILHVWGDDRIASRRSKMALVLIMKDTHATIASISLCSNDSATNVHNPTKDKNKF